MPSRPVEHQHGVTSRRHRLAQGLQVTEAGDVAIENAGEGIDTVIAGDQAFTMLNSGAFTGVAGQLRYIVVGRDTVMQGDVNGDTAADFEVQLTEIHTFVAADLVL